MVQRAVVPESTIAEHFTIDTGINSGGAIQSDKEKTSKLSLRKASHMAINSILISTEANRVKSTKQLSSTITEDPSVTH